MNSRDPKQSSSPSASGTTDNQQSRFRWLRQYRDTKIAALCFLFLLVFFWWIPTIYTLSVTIPPLEAMNRSEGILLFSDSKRWGPRMTLQEDNGTRHKFACKVSAIVNGTCGRREYAGKRAVVWWHLLDLSPLETIKHPVQIEVDRKFILTYEQSLRDISSAKIDEPWVVLGTTVFFLIVLAVIFKIDRRRHEQLND